MEERNLKPEEITFDENINELFKLFEETIEKKFGITEFINTDLLRMRRYKAVYGAKKEKNTPSYHFRYFEIAYKKVREKVLSSYSEGIWEDNWLCDNVIIQYGDGIAVDEERRKKLSEIKITISYFYKLSLEISESAKKRVDDFGEAALSDKKDLIFNKFILLRVLRIFKIISKEDSKDLEQIITTLEKELGITSGINSDSLLGGIMNLAGQLFEENGMPLPKNVAPPSDKELGKMFNSVFNNPGTKNMFSGVFGMMRDMGAMNGGTAPATTGGLENMSATISEAVKKVATSENIEKMNNIARESAEEAKKAN